MGPTLKLIDLDASVRFDGGDGDGDGDGEPEYCGMKYSSGHAPPELVYIDDEGVAIRSPTNGAHMLDEARLSQSQSQREGTPTLSTAADNEDAPSGQTYVLPSPAYDLWSLGVTLYQLASNAPLFICDGDGNIFEESDLCVLAEWSPETKGRKLSNVRNPYARNLISQLLSKDPSNRPSIDRVLAHPFLSGRQATRQAGDEAEFTVYISYRSSPVTSSGASPRGCDQELALRLHRKLTAAGISVWLDKASLKPGEQQDEDEGRSRGLASSRIFVPLMSRQALRSATDPACNWETLRTDSPCDPLLFEYRLALELRHTGLVEKIFPIFIGDGSGDASGDGCSPLTSTVTAASPQPASEDHYEKYEFAGPKASYPQGCAEEAVASVEAKLREHMDRQGLGLPLHDSQTVPEVLREITRYQGAFVEGDLASSAKEVVDEIREMIAGSPTMSMNTNMKVATTRTASSTVPVRRPINNRQSSGRWRPTPLRSWKKKALRVGKKVPSLERKLSRWRRTRRRTRTRGQMGPMKPTYDNTTTDIAKSVAVSWYNIV
jgi:hypothetical protein